MGVSFAETSSQLIQRHPDHADLIAAYESRFNESLRHEVPGVIAIVNELDARGVPLFAITNFHDGFFAAFRASRPRSERPTEFAPPIVAMWNRSESFRRSTCRDTTFESVIASFISLSMS